MPGHNKNELVEQKHIIQSVRKDGGYGKKISNHLQPGVPDLVLIVPGFVPGLWEVKDLGHVKEGFNRKVETTEMQALELMEFERACMGVSVNEFTRVTAGVLVTYHMNKHRWLTICPRDTLTVSHCEWPTIIREVHQYYRMVDLFTQFKVQKW